MNRTRWSWLGFALLLTLTSRPLFADHPPAGKIRISDRTGEDFASIQAAIDAAASGATVLVGEGRYDERLKISQPIKLIGVGPDKTVIGPTAEAREARGETFRAQLNAIREEARAQKKPADTKEVLAMRAADSVAIIKIEDAQGVELRSLRVTSPGTPRAGAGLESGFHAVEAKNAGLRVSDCAVVGCLGHGVYAEGESHLEIDDCLIAACWNTGVKTGKFSGPLKIVNSDVRNCYHHNVWVGTSSDVFIIEGCRISGTNAYGITVSGRPSITRNAIFESAYLGIDVDGDAVIKQNLIYQNNLGVRFRSSGSRSWLSGNLFLENEQGGICSCGTSDPMIRRNIFVAGKRAIEYRSAPRDNGNLESSERRYARENLFWKIDQPLSTGINHQSETTPVELSAGAKNRFEDPRITLDAAGHVLLAADSPARQFEFAGIAAVSMQGRWPLTAEERAMIPDDGVGKGSKWKMKPAAAKP